MCFAPDMPDSGKVAPNSDAASPSATPEPEQLPEEGERGETPEGQGRNHNNVIHKLVFMKGIAWSWIEGQIQLV